MERPQRWDVPFDFNMTDGDVSYLMGIAPFNDIEEQKFPKNLPLRDIVKNDTRIVNFKRGDIVVKEGDYGNSAFFILEGDVRVVLHNDYSEKLEKILLQKQEIKRRGIFSSIFQLFTNSKIAELRKRVRASKNAFSDNKESDESLASLREDESGNKRLFLQDIPGILNEDKTVLIGAGEFFGEISALGRTPRSATIYASSENTQLLEIKWQGLRDIRKYTPAIKEHIDNLYRERSLETHLKESEIFAHLSEGDLKKVADATIFKSLGSFEWFSSYQKLIKKEADANSRLNDEPPIIEQGVIAEDLVLIRSGFARISEKSGNGHRTKGYLGKGQIFGLREIYHNWIEKDDMPFQDTIRAVGHTDILIVPSYVLEEIVFPNLPKKFIPKDIGRSGKLNFSNQKHITKRDKDKSRIRTEVLEFIVEKRYMNGQKTMMINLDRCTRCDDCVQACSVSHGGNPRFVRQGEHVGSLMVANACMHCQDPVCMIGCPTGAIGRNSSEGQITINDITCIGCQTCANSCPYENIKMVQVKDQQGAFVLDGNNRPILKATKCDLCIEQMGGPACETSCPHDALVRMDMTDRNRLAKWINR